MIRTRYFPPFGQAEMACRGCQAVFVADVSIRPPRPGRFIAELVAREDACPVCRLALIAYEGTN